MNAIGSMGFLNLGATLALNELSGPATGCAALAALCAFLVFRGQKRIEQLDKFEKDIRGG